MCLERNDSLEGFMVKLFIEFMADEDASDVIYFQFMLLRVCDMVNSINTM